MAICHFHKQQIKSLMLGFNFETPSNHHQTWWPTMHRRDAIRGQRYAPRGEAVRGDVLTQSVKQWRT
ncbi:hypothetical protein ERO13_A05G278800v2 [Gossypium hirsutum]|uniref:Uncharacterized protein n=1 Tax=Gossypium barbadense TaxID=3634 RepID=A0A5J5VVR4_GOSBA|nr:hypothetical protein ES319_A05G290900v1 [Gossypium barbadense]KAG4201433.1 hypothetical protein ERO13_A05G278800v2 [Gossypium hirsutum]